MTLAEKLTQARKAAGLTQADNAEKLNVSRQAVSLWESGQSRPSTDKLSALAKIYTVSLDWLCSGTDEPVPDKLTAYTCPESEPAESGKTAEEKHSKMGRYCAGAVRFDRSYFHMDAHCKPRQLHSDRRYSKEGGGAERSDRI